jgi:hypothetical protein
VVRNFFSRSDIFNNSPWPYPGQLMRLSLGSAFKSDDTNQRTPHAKPSA